MSLTMDAVLQRARPVMPVLVLEEVGLALDLAAALQAGGVRVLEVTLRTPRALEAVSAIRQSFPDLLVGAGTVIHADQFAEVRDAGAQFAVSPGCTERLVAAAESSGLAHGHRLAPVGGPVEWASRRFNGIVCGIAVQADHGDI